MLARVNQIIKREGVKALLSRIYYRAFLGGYQNAVYRQWVKKKESWNIEDVSRQIDDFNYKPKISISVAVYNIDAQILDKCIRSVLKQYYPHWELCLYDDASSRKDTLSCLKKWEQLNDPRIKVKGGQNNQQISLALNEAVKMTTGEFIAILDHDDELAPAALYEVVKLINQHHDAALIYSDEDKIDRRGRRSSPFFKPDWSPELLLSANYLNHLCVIRKEVGDKLGWFRQGYEGAQDYDLFLRIADLTDKIFHIPEVLYHWRSLAGSTAAAVDEKKYCGPAGVKALEDYLALSQAAATVSQGFTPTEYHVKFQPKGNPLISIIVPFKDKVELLRNCLDKVLALSCYKNFEVVLISNNSKEKETYDFLDELAQGGDARLRAYQYDSPFNYSRINNWGVKQAKGEILLFLNNDTEAITPSWLEDMLGYAQRREIGAVGAKLFYRDGSIQHAGVILGMGGFADHAFVGYEENSFTPFGKDTWSRDYLAVTAACLMLERKKFESIGGFDENFIVCGNDVELCLRLYQSGHRNVFLSFVKLYHLEAQTRKKWVDPQDFECSLKSYVPYLENGDPYYNRNLSLEANQAKAFASLNLS